MLSGAQDDDIAVFRFGEGDGITPLLETEFTEAMPEISPTGQWMAYVSNESGRDEVYVRPFPDVLSGRSQISTDGGTEPLWSRDGTELFYRNEAAVMAVSVQSDASFEAGSPQVVFQGDYVRGPGGRSYDVSLEGDRFLMLKEVEEAFSSSQVIIVQNWFEDLERLAPTD